MTPVIAPQMSEMMGVPTTPMSCVFMATPVPSTYIGTNADAIPPKRLGIPCKLLMPHVSVLPEMMKSCLQKPMVEIAPAISPISTAPNGPSGKLAVAPIDTPPANVAFWIGTVVKRPSEKIGVKMKVMTVDAISARIVLRMAMSCPVPAGSAPATKLGQKSQRNTVPMRENKSDVYVLPFRSESDETPRVAAQAKPK